LKYPIEVFNVDETPNKQGTITKYTWLDLTINGQMQTHNLLVTGLGKQKIILGYPWFKQTNPDINWKECTLTWQTKQDKKKPMPKPTIENEIDPEDWKNHTVNLIEELDDEQIRNAVLLSYIEKAKLKVWINAKTGIAMELAIKENEKKADLPVENLIPEDLHDFLDVFDDNCQGFTKSHSGSVRMDSNRRDLKDILMTISPRTTSDLSWKASAW
jgi:hypothetical protein